MLFGFDRAAANIAKAPHREAIVCEGQIDTIRLHVSGFPVAVASQGTAFTEDHAKMLKRVADTVLLVFDDDAAGHKATIRTAALLLAADMPVRVVSLPGGEDPDSFLRKNGAAEFQKLIDGAESIVSFQCRIETAKERNSKSIDAVSRISKSVLATIAACPGAVLRASMVDEAARLIGLPPAALAEELEKIKQPPAIQPQSVAAGEADYGFDEASDDYADAAEDVEMAGEDAGEVAPPPKLEIALMEFLLANERDNLLDGMIGEFLPKSVFIHDFTWRFVEAWRVDAVGGGEALVAFAHSLSPREHAWFDGIMLSAGRTNAGGRTVSDIMQEFVRKLWHDHLVMRRGALPAVGDAEADVERLNISFALKRLDLARWHDVKDIVRRLTIKGE